MIARTLLFLASICFTMGLFAQLSGNYTVGGTNPDYPSITDAINALNSMGANGDVTFDIRPGTYTGQYVITVISGTPGEIMFRSETGNPDDVSLEYSATGEPDNFILELDSADRITLKDLTFHPLDDIYAKAILFHRDADALTIDNCTFLGSPSLTTSAGFRRYLVHCDQSSLGAPENPDSLTVIDSRFMYGNTALYLQFRGFQGSRSQNLLIDGNEFMEQRSTGVRVNNAIGVVSNNEFRAEEANFYTGLSTSYLQQSQVYGNVVVASSVNDCSGIEFGNTQNTTGNLVYNNMVHVASQGSAVGIGVWNLWGTEVQYNSVFVSAGDPSSSYAFYHLSNFTDSETTVVENNIFANYGGGKAFHTKVPTNIAGEDHNDLFTNGDTLTSFGGSGYATLTDHQNGTGFGANSVSMDPAYPHLPDLHLNSCALEGLAQPNALVSLDIDGDVRNPSTPDMGADEFTFSSGTIAGPNINITSADLPYGLSAPNGSAYNWSTGETIQTTQVNMSGTYTCTFTDANGCTYTVSYTVNVDITTGIEESDVLRSFVYPNPTDGVLWVEGIEQPTVYSIIDMRGSIIGSGIIQPSGSLSARHFDTGIYLLQLEGLNGMETIRFQVMNK